MKRISGWLIGLVWFIKKTGCDWFEQSNTDRTSILNEAFDYPNAFL